MNRGRKVIYTDVPYVTSENIIPILQKAMPTFTQNAADCDYLLKYEAGEQPLQRKKAKEYRKDIDFENVDNVANEVTEFKLGFVWGNPITLVQRGEKDSGDENEALAIALLNECYETDGNKSKTQQLARFIEICGIGYTLVDVNMDYEDGDSYFNVNVLDPRWAFVIHSSYYSDHRPMIAVTFRKDEIGNFYFTCYTKEYRFEILNLAKFIGKKPVDEPMEARKWNDTKRWGENERSGEKNPLGMIPIIEWKRSHDYMGCFERQIDEMNSLNLMWSDLLNDVDQNCQAIWHGNDIEFPVDENGDTQKPQSNDWIVTHTSQDGKTPFVKPLAVEYNYSGMLENYQYARSRILEKCHIPSRTDGNNSTGLATSQAAGWEDAENDACKEQNVIETCKMLEVRAVLAATKKSPYVPSDSPLLDLRYGDCQPNVKRQKTYEMVTKSTTFGNLVSHGIDGLHALKAINLFEDVNQVYADSKELIEKYQSSIFDKQNTSSDSGDEPSNTDGGQLAQITNSPYVDGRSNEELSEPKE
jgi:SPP1 family phage portal protein